MLRGSRLLGLLALLPALSHAANDVCDDYGRLTGSDALDAGDVTLTLAQKAGSFGFDVAVVGDINGDGFEDVAIGAPGAAMNGAGSGAVYVFYGPFSGTGDFKANQADVVFAGPAPGARMGTEIAGVGDVDGDGYDDLLLGLVPDPSSPSSGYIPEGGALLVSGQPTFAGVVDTLAVAEARIRGAGEGDDFGVSLSGAGDVNGDGFADIIIGAPLADGPGGFNSGAAYVFYGPVAGDLSAADASRTLLGARPDGRAGASVAMLGDLDGDGLADMAIGAPREDTNGSKAGAMYIVPGAYGAPGAAGYTLQLTCDPAADPNCGTEGFGAENLEESAFILRGSEGDRLGNTMAVAGDVNHDGYSDFWVGAHQQGASKRGAVYLMHGGPDLWGDHVAEARYASRIHGVDAVDTFGTSISGNVDFDGDGHIDVLVGAERADGDQLGSGAAYVIHGPFPTDSSAAEHDHIIRGSERLDFAGGATAAFDINQDGFADALVGAWRADTAKLRAGRVSVFYGGADLVDIRPWYADVDGDGWGTTVSETWACVAPVTGWVARNGDCDDTDTAYHPYALELDCSDPNDYNCDGSVGLVDEDGDGVMACEGDCRDIDPQTRPGADERCWDNIDNNCDGGVDDGLSVEGRPWFPDADGDGYGNRDVQIMSCDRPDILVGDVVNTGGDCDDLSEAIFPGAAEYCDGVDNNCNNTTDENSSVDALPWYQDADGDGRGSVVDRMDACSPPLGYVEDKGDCDDTNPEIYPGAIEICNYVDDDCDGFAYHGGPEVIDDPIAEFWGERSGDRFGGRVELVPDMNGDGYAESLIAAHWNTERARNAGGVYLRFGDPDGGIFDMAEVLDDGTRRYTARILADQADGFFGESLAAGDFNGDGIGDIAVGAPGMKGPGLDAGGVFIFYGPLAGEYTHRDADVWWRGEANYDHLGAGLTAGDLDGDGMDDLIMGATGVAADGDRRGRAYVVYGTPDWTNGTALQVADAWLSGREDKEFLGETVAILGDVNADGFSDFAVGAPKAGSLDVGTALVVHGSDTRMGGVLVEDGEFGGYRSSGEIGVALVGPGDVNGDGYDDVLIGSQGNEAFLMLGSPSGMTYGRINEVYDHRLFGPDDSFEFAGASLSRVGDANADGIDDMLIGARESDTNGADSGAVYMVYGGASLPTELDLGLLESKGRVMEERTFPTFSTTNLGRWEGGKLMGADAYHQFGSAISGGEDVNNDGYPDMLISSVWADEGRGRVAVVYNSPYGIDWEAAPGSDWNYALTMDGQTTDWVDTIRSGGVDGDDYAVTWTPSQVFLGFEGSDVLAGGPNHRMVAYLGNGDAVGSTTGMDFVGQAADLTFAADVAVVLSPNSASATLHTFDGTGWQSGDPIETVGGMLAMADMVAELAIPRAALGDVDTLQVAAAWMFVSPASGVSYNSLPSEGFSGTIGNPAWSQHMEFDVNLPLAPNNYPLQPGGGAPPHVEDSWEAWIHDRDLDGQGDDTPTFFYACPMHAPMHFPNGVFSPEDVIVAGVQDPALATDCNDYNDTVYLGAREIAGDGLDNDCIEDINNIPVVTVTMDPVFTDEIATARVEVEDADDGTPQETSLTLYYEWFVNGERVIGQDGSTLDGNLYFDKNDVVVVHVTAFDGIDTSEVSTATFTTPNAPPVVEDCWFEPAAISIAEDVNLHCDASDRDGDEVFIDTSGLNEACAVCPEAGDPSTFNWIEWTSPVQGKVLSGVVNGIPVVYSSTADIGSTQSVYGHHQFPADYNIPNVNPTIRTTEASTHKLEFGEPVVDPLLVFSSVGRPNLDVPVLFDRPIEVLFETGVVSTTETSFVGREGYVAVRVPGVHTSISFDYTVNEYYSNFVFGFAAADGICSDGGVCDIIAATGSSGFAESPDWQGQTNADPFDGSSVIPADANEDGFTLEPHLAIRALVTANDGEDESEPYLTDILRPGEVPIDTSDTDGNYAIPNTPPVATVCEIAPRPLHYTEDAVVSVVGTDEDEDPISFTVSWLVNGSLVNLEQVPNNTTSTLSMVAYDVGDEVIAVCTPFDGEDLGDPINDRIVVRDFGDTGIDPVDTADTDGTDDTDDTDVGPVCVDNTDLRYQLTAKSWGYEIGWTIQTAEGDVVFSPGNVAYPNHSVHNYEFTLEPGYYRVHMTDSYGDGWNGGYFEMFDERGDDSLLAFTGGLSSGSEIYHVFEVECDGDINSIGEFFPEGDSFSVCGEVNQINPTTGEEEPADAASITAAFDTTDNIIGGVLTAENGSYCLTGIVIPDSWNPSTEPYFLTATKLGYAAEVKTSPFDFTPSIRAQLTVDFLLTPIDIEICFEEDFETETQWTYDNPVAASHDVGWTRYAYDSDNPIFNEAIPTCVEQPEDELCNSYSVGCVLCENPNDKRCIPAPSAIPTPWGGQHYAWFGNETQGAGNLAGGSMMGRGGTCDPNSGSTGNGGWSTINDMEGNLLSPYFRVPLGDAEVQLSAWFEIESVDPHKPPNGYDQLVVSVVNQETGVESMIGSMNSQIDLDGRPAQNYASGGFGKAPAWNLYRFDMSAYEGETVQLKFRFWSRDEKYNAFRGWGVDDIFVYTTEVGGCLDIGTSPEVCNGIDDDGDGIIDNNPTDGNVAYADLDGDGFGDPDAPYFTCDEDPGPPPEDCDDSDPGTNPLAPDVQDGVDNDCDGNTDEVDVAFIAASQCNATTSRANATALEFAQVEAFLLDLDLTSERINAAPNGSIASDINLADYSLVFYTKCGWSWEGYNTGDIEAIEEAAESGASTFFFGDDMAFRMSRTPSAEPFVMLAPSNNNGTGHHQSTMLFDTSTNHPAYAGSYGTPVNYSYAWDMDRSTVTLDGAITLARHGVYQTPVFVAWEDPDEGRRQATLLASVYNANHGSPGSAARINGELVFKNTVTWLLHLDE